MAENGAVTPGNDGKVVLEAGGKQIIMKVSDGTPAELTLDEGSELTLVSDAEIKWSSGNDRVATFDKDGNLTALREGATTVTGDTADGLVAEIRIIVQLTANGTGR